MSDDHQEIMDQIFEKISERLKPTEETSLLAQTFSSGTEGHPSGSSCPAGPLPQYTEGDTMSIYLSENTARIGLADEDGNLVDIHAVTCEHGSTVIHIKVNDTEVVVPPEFWEAAVLMMEDELDNDE